jgi:predicted Zn-dependent protease
MTNPKPFFLCAPQRTQRLCGEFPLKALFRDFAVLAVLSAAVGCKSSSADLTPEQEYYAGRAFSANVLQEYKSIVRSPSVQQYVYNVGTVLAVHSARPETHLGPWHSYHFAVLDTDNVNAFAAPSGFVFVTKGLLRKCETEDELAAVIAHEIGHVALRHPEDAAATAKQHAEQAELLGSLGKALGQAAAEYGAQEGKEKLQQIGQIADQYAQDFAKAMNEVFGNLIRKGYDRDKELAADRAGVDLLAKVGYDPLALRRVLERMGKPQKGVVGWLGDTHPAPQDRVAAIDQHLAQRSAEGKPLKEARVETARTERFKKAVAKLK